MLNAKDAKQMKEDAINAMLEKLGDAVGEKIEAAAKQGESRISVGVGEITKFVTTTRFVDYLEEKGFAIENDGAYIVIEW